MCQVWSGSRSDRISVTTNEAYMQSRVHEIKFPTHRLEMLLHLPESACSIEKKFSVSGVVLCHKWKLAPGTRTETPRAGM